MSHYVIKIDITHVTEKEVPATGRGMASTERVVEDVTHVVTKSSGLEPAVEKAVSILRLELEAD